MLSQNEWVSPAQCCGADKYERERGRTASVLLGYNLPMSAMNLSESLQVTLVLSSLVPISNDNSGMFNKEILKNEQKLDRYKLF